MKGDNLFLRQMTMAALVDMLDDAEPVVGPVGSTGIWGMIVDVRGGIVTPWQKIGTITAPGQFEWNERVSPQNRESIGKRLTEDNLSWAFETGPDGQEWPDAVLYVTVSDTAPPDVSDDQICVAARTAIGGAKSDPFLMLASLLGAAGVDVLNLKN